MEMSIDTIAAITGIHRSSGNFRGLRISQKSEIPVTAVGFLLGNNKTPMRILLSIVFIVSISCSMAAIDPASFDASRLAKLMLDACNEHRAANDLYAVEYDKLLEDASHIHSEYQFRIGALEHGQSKVLKGMEQDHQFYNLARGGAYGEICLQNWVDFENETYEMLADKLITQWKNSKGHNAIMLDKQLKYAAFGVHIEDDSGLIYATGIFKYNPVQEDVYAQAYGSTPDAEGPIAETTLRETTVVADPIDEDTDDRFTGTSNVEVAEETTQQDKRKVPRGGHYYEYSGADNYSKFGYKWRKFWGRVFNR